ncbi:hypothetical protein GA0061094_0403 [[Bacillus] enclensis]|uniref:Uncharacterized protein n=1 Tax=[Bacillus] enclensis TaxID=1402860 RepID=A0A1C3Z4L7_9BACI|nr:hypothetical protein GA0061094_0403 [[Bacillus] enclensis]
MRVILMREGDYFDRLNEIISSVGHYCENPYPIVKLIDMLDKRIALTASWLFMKGRYQGGLKEEPHNMKES